MQDSRISSSVDQSLEQLLSEILQKISPEKADGFVSRLSQFLEEQGDSDSRLEKLTEDSARRQFFKAIYDRDVDLVRLLLEGSRRKYVHANLVCPDDRWTALHACLYKYNQYPPDDTLKIVDILLKHQADVNKPCPDGAVAINVLDKKPLPNGQQNGPDNPNREKKTVSFQNKMVLDVAIDFLQAYKWAGCRPSVLQNWKPLIQKLDEASTTRKQQVDEFESKYAVEEPETVSVYRGYNNKFRKMLEERMSCDCTIICGSKDEFDFIDDTDEERVVKAHRAILMASSRFFHQMFSNDMQEKQSGQILLDAPKQSVELMLEYIYCGKIPSVNLKTEKNEQSGIPIDILLHVLCLADMYEISDLKDYMQYILHRYINDKTALRILIAAEKYTAQALKGVSLNYVCTHFQRLSSTDKFKEFGKEHSNLLQEILSIVTKECQHRPHDRLKMVMSTVSQRF